jgi:hypothetical protein
MANQEAIQMIPIPSPLKESSSSYLEMSIHPLTSFAEDISKLCHLCQFEFSTHRMSIPRDIDRGGVGDHVS